MSWLVICALLTAGDGGERVVVRWAVLPDAVLYELQIASDPEFRNILLTQRTQVPGYRWQRERNVAVFFRVRGWDAHGNPGEWSEPREVKARAAPPEKPPPVAPRIEGPRAGTWWRAGRAVELSWSSPESATRWRVELEGPGQPARSEETAESRFRFVPSLPGMHRWRARQLEPEVGPWSGWSTVDVRLAPPVLAAPAAKSVQPCGSVALTWQVLASAPAYHVEVARDKTFKEIAHSESVTEPMWTTPALEAGAYWWRVSGREASRRTGMRASRGFTVVCLAAPQLVAPALNAVFEAGREVRLEWGVVKDAARYDLEVDGEARPSTSPEFRVEDLALGEHTWRARGVTATGYAGPWSEARTLSLETPRTVRAEWTPEQPRTLTGGEAVLDIQLFAADGAPVRAAPITVDATAGTITSVTETDGGYRVVYRAPEAAGDDSIAIRDREFVAHATIGFDAPPRRFQAGARLGWQLSGLGNLTSPTVSIDVVYALPILPLQVSARFGYLRHAATIPANDGVPEIEQVAHVVPITLAAAFVAPLAGFDLYAGGGLVIQAAALSVGPESSGTVRLGFEGFGGGTYAIGPGFACAELAMSFSGLEDELLRLPTDTLMLSVGYRMPIF